MHIRSECKSYTVTSLETIMEQPPNAPLNKEEKKIGDHVVRRMLAKNTTIQITTKGTVSKQTYICMCTHTMKQYCIVYT